MTIINVDRLHKSFGEKKVLKNLNLKIKQGEIIGIKGHNGAGKTTLLRILNLLEDYDCGNLKLFRSIPANGNRLDIQRKMAMVFQKPVVFNSTIYHNVAFGLKVRGFNKDIINKKVNLALKQVKLNNAHKNALKLSGGEAQRIALARTLVLNPKLLLLDEPTANLDSANVKLIENLLLDMNKKLNTTILVTSHDHNHIKRICEKTYTMKEGRLI